jgi:hypothetical protein
MQGLEEKSSAPVRDWTPVFKPTVRHCTAWAARNSEFASPLQFYLLYFIEVSKCWPLARKQTSHLLKIFIYTLQQYNFKYRLSFLAKNEDCSHKLCLLMSHTNKNCIDSNLEIQEATICMSLSIRWISVLVQSLRNLLCGPWHCSAWSNCTFYCLLLRPWKLVSDLIKHDGWDL